MKELADGGIPVAVTCRVLKLARQPYYRWLANPITDAEYVEAHRANMMKKMRVSNTAQLLKTAIQDGTIKIR